MTYLDYLCCRAKEWFARGRYLIKFRSYGITNVQGRGRNELTLLETFSGYFIELLFWTTFAEDHGHFFSSFFKEDSPRPFWYEYFQREIFKNLTLFGVNRHAVEILGWSCGGIVWRKWMTTPGIGDCHTRHFEASKEMGTRRRKTGRWQVLFLEWTHHSTMIKVNQDSLW